jgi:Flp pilus assembly protein TadG
MSRDRGSLSIEYVIITPFVFLVFGLIYAFGRVSAVDGSLDTGTRDAARAASLAADPAQAQDVAERAVRAEIGNGTSTCRSTLSVEITPKNFAAGDTITVQASCRYDLSDILYLPSVVAPGTITVHSQFSAVVDPNRSLG